jgi:hypothetical protein
MKYQVICGNIGTVHNGNNKKEALSIYLEYVKMSKDGYGRSSSEDVYLICNGEPIREYFGTNNN